jgi:hypothetical protein
MKRVVPALPPGEGLQFPIGFYSDGRRATLADFADQGMTLVMTWQWTDERRVLLWRVRHRSRLESPIGALREDLTQALTIVPSDPLVAAIHELSVAVGLASTQERPVSRGSPAGTPPHKANL